MRAPDATPFRAVAVQRYVHTPERSAVLQGMTSRRIGILWVLVGVSLAVACATFGVLLTRVSA